MCIGLSSELEDVVKSSEIGEMADDSSGPMQVISGPIVNQAKPLP